MCCINLINMTEDNAKVVGGDFDFRDEFFSKNGRRIHKPREVKVGDIFGVISPKIDEVTLSYVDFVHLDPNFIKFDYFPYIKLKGPFFRLSISKDLEPVGYTALILDPKYSIGRIWRPEVISLELPLDKQETQREFLKEMEEESLEDFAKDDRAYVINKGICKKLGNLIPLVELPELSFLPQSRSLDKLIRMIKDSKEDIEALRTVSDRIRKIYQDS